MDDKEFIRKIKDLKQIKPDSDWADWLLSNILTQKPEPVSLKPRVKLASFFFLPRYKKVLAPVFFAVLFISTLSFAQTTLPGNLLYPVKTLTQNARITLAPRDYKPVIRMQITKARLEDMAKVSDQEQAMALMSQNIQKDLQTIPQELKNIQKKQKTLDISKQVQTEAKDLNNMIARTQLQPQDKEALEKTTQDTQAQVLALIIDTTEEINQCPGFLQDKLANLQKYFTENLISISQWPVDDVAKTRVFLTETAEAMKTGNCLEALEKIESINQILRIHSLEIKVETSTPLEIDF